ncbi:hypothetical protein H2248_005262 [Termitomyces sp. 'cryptogamus']|nr:hypothetical protein H2248_005262 [Termitomyces sp. 'cryptogamus']
MSIVSSYISSRAPVFKIDVQASTFIDHILAIVAGLGVRVVIDFVGYEDHKLTGSLVGFWEGVVVQHFITKSPKSFDPYVAYSVRVFIDFLFTESLIRLVLTFLFTGMGIVFADIAPRVWAETGLRRFWRHLRRDLYILVHSVASIPYFARPRTVRFSSSRAPSAITSIPPSPSINTITTQAPTAPVPRKRPVPGSFPDYVSETDTDLSIRSPGLDYSILAGRSRDRRPTVQTETETSYDPDEGNQSSSVASGSATPVLSEADLPNLPNIEDEDVAREVVLENPKDENTPRPLPIHLPPTPSDSIYPIRLNADESHEIPPPSATLPQIPDDEEWGNISRREFRATPLASYKDKSTSPFVVEPQLSSHPDQMPASKTPLAGAQPAHLPLGDARQPEVPEIDPHAEQTPMPMDETPTTTSPNMNAPPVTKKESEFDLLGDFNTNTSDPVAQNNESGPPSYSQFDFRGYSLSPNLLWGPSPLAASSGGDMGIWGDVKGNITAGNDDVFGTDATDLSNRLLKQDFQIGSIAEEDEQQDSNAAPKTDLSAVPTAEAPETSASRQSDSSTLRKDQDLTSSSIRPEGMTSQQAEGTDPVLNRTTVAESLNIQEDDADPAGKEAAGGQPSSTEETKGSKDEKPQTGSENVEAVTLTAPVIDEEPFPEKNSDRLDKALELRNEISRIEKDIIQIQSKLARSSSTTSRVEILAQIEKEEEKLKSLKAKAERWYSLVSQSDEKPSTTVDLSEAPAQSFMGSAQTAIIACLLKNIRNVVILVGPADDKKGKGKARRNVLTARLDKLDLASRIYQVGNKEVTVTLPTSSS